jgi:hypothetical protein
MLADMRVEPVNEARLLTRSIFWNDLHGNASKTFYRPLRFQRSCAYLLFMVGIVIAVILTLHLKMDGGQIPNLSDF